MTNKNKYQDKYGYFSNIDAIIKYINNTQSAKVVEIINQPENKMVIFVCRNNKKVMYSLKHPWLWHAFYIKTIDKWRLITFDKEHMRGLHTPINMELWYKCSASYKRGE